MRRLFLAERPVLTETINPQKTMKEMTVRLMAAVLVFGTLYVKAQISEIQNFTNLNKSIPDGNASGLTSIRT